MNLYVKRTLKLINFFLICYKFDTLVLVCFLNDDQVIQINFISTIVHIEQDLLV